MKVLTVSSCNSCSFWFTLYISPVGINFHATEGMQCLQQMVGVIVGWFNDS
jgi:hypothetical protein